MARPISDLTKLILSLPREAPVAEVIQHAEKNGMSTSANNVHRVRAKHAASADGTVGKKGSTPKRGSRARRTTKPAKTPKQVAGPPTPSAEGDAAQALRVAAVALVLDVGVDRARAVFEAVVERIHALRTA